MSLNKTISDIYNNLHYDRRSFPEICIHLPKYSISKIRKTLDFLVSNGYAEKIKDVETGISSYRKLVRK